LLRRLENGPQIGPVHIPARPGVQAVGLALIMLLVLIFRPRGLTQGKELRWIVRQRRDRATQPIAGDLPSGAAGVAPKSGQTDIAIEEAPTVPRAR
jgi:branched-chain amino acid transport system permease protein